jgi:ABC-type long-subunit fatty acid transport system fused permease/ATPase subunit
LWATLSFSSMLGQTGIHLVGAWLAGIALFNGLFTLRTQIVPLPLPARYLYVVGSRARSVGRIQVIAALVQIVVSVSVTAVLNP